MTAPENNAEPAQSARYAHGPEIAARVTEWVETTRRDLAAIEADTKRAREGLVA